MNHHIQIKNNQACQIHNLRQTIDEFDIPDEKDYINISPYVNRTARDFNQNKLNHIYNLDIKRPSTPFLEKNEKKSSNKLKVILRQSPTGYTYSLTPDTHNNTGLTRAIPEVQLSDFNNKSNHDESCNQNLCLNDSNTKKKSQNENNSFGQIQDYNSYRKHPSKHNYSPLSSKNNFLRKPTKHHKGSTMDKVLSGSQSSYLINHTKDQNSRKQSKEMCNHANNNNNNNNAPIIPTMSESEDSQKGPGISIPISATKSNLKLFNYLQLNENENTCIIQRKEFDFLNPDDIGIIKKEESTSTNKAFSKTLKNTVDPKKILHSTRNHYDSNKQNVIKNNKAPLSEAINVINKDHGYSPQSKLLQSPNKKLMVNTTLLASTSNSQLQSPGLISQENKLKNESNSLNNLRMILFSPNESIINDGNYEGLKKSQKRLNNQIKKFSNKQTNELINKLLSKNHKTEAEIKKIAEDLQKKEFQECTFQPIINKKNQSPHRNFQDFLKDQNNFLQKVESKLMLIKEQKEIEESQEVLLIPSIDNKSREIVLKRQEINPKNRKEFHQRLFQNKSPFKSFSKQEEPTDSDYFSKNLDTSLKKNQDWDYQLFSPLVTSRSKEPKSATKAGESLYLDALRRQSKSQSPERNGSSLIIMPNERYFLNKSQKLLASKLVKEYQEKAHHIIMSLNEENFLCQQANSKNYNNSVDGTPTPHLPFQSNIRRFNYIQMCEIFLVMDFIKKFDNIYMPQFIEQRTLLCQIWRILKGDLYNGINERNLLSFIFAICGINVQLPYYQSNRIQEYSQIPGETMQKDFDETEIKSIYYQKSIGNSRGRNSHDGAKKVTFKDENIAKEKQKNIENFGIDGKNMGSIEVNTNRISNITNWSSKVTLDQNELNNPIETLSPPDDLGIVQGWKLDNFYSVYGSNDQHEQKVSVKQSHSEYNIIKTKKSNSVNNTISEENLNLNFFSKMNNNLVGNIGSFDTNENILFSNEEVQLIYKAYKIFYINKLSSQNSNRKSQKSLSSSSININKPEISNKSRELSEKYKQNQMLNATYSCEKFKTLSPNHGSISQPELLINDNKREIISSHHKEERYKIRERELNECAYRPLIKEFNKPIKKRQKIEHDYASKLRQILNPLNTNHNKANDSTYNLMQGSSITYNKEESKIINSINSSNKGLDPSVGISPISINRKIKNDDRISNGNNNENVSNFSPSNSVYIKENRVKSKVKKNEKPCEQIKKGFDNTKVKNTTQSRTNSREKPISTGKAINKTVPKFKRNATNSPTKPNLVPINDNNNRGANLVEIFDDRKIRPCLPAILNNFKENYDNTRTNADKENATVEKLSPDFSINLLNGSKVSAIPNPINAKNTQFESNVSPERIPILHVHVNLGPNQSEKIIVYEGDEPEILAMKFAQKHHLNEPLKNKLRIFLQNQISGNLIKIEEEIISSSEIDRLGSSTSSMASQIKN